MSIENPFLGDDIKGKFPDDHPMNEQTLLTPLESLIYPALLWFFDSERNRGQGRSYLMARVYIELAMRGRKIYLTDCSTIPHLSNNQPRNDQHFLNCLTDLLKGPFKKYLFEINRQNMTLEYKGRRPN